MADNPPECVLVEQDRNASAFITPQGLLALLWILLIAVPSYLHTTIELRAWSDGPLLYVQDRAVKRALFSGLSLVLALVVLIFPQPWALLFPDPESVDLGADTVVFLLGAYPTAKSFIDNVRVARNGIIGDLLGLTRSKHWREPKDFAEGRKMDPMKIQAPPSDEKEHAQMQVVEQTMDVLKKQEEKGKNDGTIELDPILEERFRRWRSSVWTRILGSMPLSAVATVARGVTDRGKALDPRITNKLRKQVATHLVCVRAGAILEHGRAEDQLARMHATKLSLKAKKCGTIDMSQEGQFWARQLEAYVDRFSRLMESLGNVEVVKGAWRKQAMLVKQTEPALGWDKAEALSRRMWAHHPVIAEAYEPCITALADTRHVTSTTLEEIVIALCADHRARLRKKRVQEFEGEDFGDDGEQFNLMADQTPRCACVLKEEEAIKAAAMKSAAMNQSNESGGGLTGLASLNMTSLESLKPPNYMVQTPKPASPP